MNRNRFFYREQFSVDMTSLASYIWCSFGLLRRQQCT